jgi:predicted DCC family thiol-disulfide oxidoreductase YuxK
MNEMTGIDGPVLLYDGTCGLCHAIVQFVLRHDYKKALRFASLGGAYGRSVTEARPELKGLDSVVWVEPATDTRPARFLTRSAAALQVAAYLGGVWNLMRALALIPPPLRDRVYDLVARHRHRVIGSAGECIVPPTAERDRFLDQEF